MSRNNPDVKPYLVRVKNWKVRNMVMLYLEAREQFKDYHKMIRSGAFISFAKIRDICDIMFEIKEDHHLLFKRLLDPRKMRFEPAHKFTPDRVEIEFMNNVGLLFHKSMVARELKYTMEHYMEGSEAFKKTSEDLLYNLNKMNSLFDEGIDIVRNLIRKYSDNVLLLTLLLENTALVKRHFNQSAVELLKAVGDGFSLDEMYFLVGSFYANSGWLEKAKSMLKETLRRNPGHRSAQEWLNQLANA